MAFILAALFLYDLIKERRESQKILVATVIMLLGIASTIIMLIPQIDQYSGSNFFGYYLITQSLASALFPFFANPNIPIYLSLFMGLLWLPFIIIFLRSWQSKIIFLLPLIWLEYIFLFKHSGDLRHYGLILIFFIFAWWLDLIIYNRRTVKTRSLINKTILSLLLACLIINVAFAFSFFWKNGDKLYSGSREMAQFIKNSKLEREEIATYPSYSGSALLPYLPGKEFYQLDARKKGSFLTWNNAFFIGLNTPYPVLKNYLQYYYSLPENKVKSVLLLTTFPPQVDPKLELIFQTSKECTVKDEFFYLYRFRLE